MRFTLTPFLIAIPLLAGCDNKGTRARQFLGPTAATVLDAPSRIEGWRIRGDAGKAPTTGPSKPLDPALARELATILLDDGTYLFDAAKGCIFQPGVGLRVWRGEKSFDVILCFKCDELKIVSPDPKTKDRPYTIEDFDNARPALIALVKKAFPDDAEIQSLK